MTVTAAVPQTTDLLWRMPDVFMLRTGGLPIEVADALTLDATAAWARRVLDLETRLRAAGQELADALEQAVARNLDDERLRRRLIQLRRDVYNLRRPRPADPEAWPVDQLGADTHERLRDWLKNWSSYQVEQARGPGLLDQELTTQRAVLGRLADDPDLRAGIMLASPSLDQYLSKYLSGAKAPGKRGRRVERSLLEYAFRTACKTSPFSRLTTVNLGILRSGTGHLLSIDPEAARAVKQGHSRLNLAVLGRLSAIVLADEELSADLPVTVTTGWRVEHGRIRYLRRRRMSTDDGDAPVTLESIHESLFMLPSGRLLTDILSALDGGRVLRLADLVRQLADQHRSHDDIVQYLHHLLRLGLLVVPNLQLDIHCQDPVGGYQSALRAIGTGWAERLADRIGTVNELAAGFAAKEIEGRREVLRRIRAELAAAHEELGRADVAVPRTLVYEDSTLATRTAVSGDRDRWERDVLPGLQALARLMPAFDINLPRRLATKGFFLARYGVGGRCDDLLSFAHEFQQDFFEHYNGRMMQRRPFDENNAYVRQENWFRMPEITALDDARIAVAQRINDVYGRAPAGADELVLDDAFMTEIAQIIPDSLGTLDPRSFFLQIADNGVDQRVVVNRIYSGMTLLFSRFAYLFEQEDLAGTLRAELTRLQPPGAVLAELKGGYDATNLNLHPAVTPYELVCPGELSFRPQDEQIHMDDLIIEHDPVEDRVLLRSRRLGTEVIPVYLGFLLPIALPEVQQVLLNFAYVGMAQLDLWAGTEVPLPGKGIAGYPRIRYRNLVLQRRMWKLHPEYLPPSRTPDQSEADWFLSWARWRRENGLPRRVFATSEGSRLTTAAAVEGGGEQDGGGAGDRPDHKPLYVDFDSLFSLQLLDAAARKAGSRMVLTEMLPDRDEQALKVGDHSYVTELTVELNGVRRRRDEHG